MSKPKPQIRQGKRIKGSARKANLKKAKTPAMKRNQVEREIREGLIKDLRGTIYAAQARQVAKKPSGLKKVNGLKRVK